MYLDPGFGSMIIQVIVAAFAACGMCLAIFRNRIKALFQRKKNEQASAVAPEDVDDADSQKEPRA